MNRAPERITNELRTARLERFTMGLRTTGRPGALTPTPFSKGGTYNSPPWEGGVGGVGSDLGHWPSVCKHVDDALRFSGNDGIATVEGHQPWAGANAPPNSHRR